MNLLSLSKVGSTDIHYQSFLDNLPRSNLFNAWLEPQLQGGIPIEAITLSLNAFRGDVIWLPSTGEVRSF